MGTLVAIGIFLGVLFVLILVHEWGHFIAAKKTGMRVDEFAIGFPPRLITWRRGETLFSISALPIGGYVKILGENGDGEEVLSPSDAVRTFSARPRWAQAIVLIAGVTMNVLLAWVIFFGLLAVGAPTVVDETTASSNATLVVTSVMSGAPADTVIPPQATIISVQNEAGDTALLTPSAVSAFIGEAGNSPVTVIYEQSGETATVTLTPTAGLVAGKPEQHVLGVGLALVDVVRQPLLQAVVMATEQTVHMTKNIIVGVATLFSGMVTGDADLSSVAGPVGIVGYVGDAAQSGIVSLLMFTAIISLNLAVINLLPIPALDGGRLLFVAIESMIRRPINPIWMGRVNFIGFALLILLMIVVTINDVWKLF
jgi:regulator of sigma E protease